MKKILMLIMGVMLGLSAKAQFAKWIIPPMYDSIMVKVDNHVLVTDSAEWTALWTLDGQCMFKTIYKVMPYSNGVATVVRQDDNTMTGFVDMYGKFTSLPNVSIVCGSTSFNDGYLIFRSGETLGYYNLDGDMVRSVGHIRCYPFHRGYAVYYAYIDPDKQKDPHYGYYTSSGQKVRCEIRYDGEVKDFELQDVGFLSSIGSNGKGVAVIKDKLYWFDATEGVFEPLLWGNEKSEKKRHLKIKGNFKQYFQNLPFGDVAIRAEYGKKQEAILRFDGELVPTQFTFDGEDVFFKEETPAAASYPTQLSTYGEGNKQGLSMESKQVLPPQFDAVGLMYDNKAFVKCDGKWGVIEILPDLTFSITVNKGEDIAFRHQKFETQIRLDLPAAISAKEARIDIPASTGCVIDKTSRVTKDTESGNFVLYDCDLNIPSSLPDTITEITYSPVTVSYDGISMFDVPVKVRAWHLKYYNVDPIDSETTVANGVASFTININAQRNVGEGDYPFEVKIEADSITVEYEKISETRYKCTVYNLQEGNNSLNIFVTEKGCPSSVFPFEITYTKPVPRKKKKEEVVIRKKSPEAKKETATPRLEI